MTASDITHEALRSVLYPHLAKELAEVQAAGSRFAYYTSAETAVRILKGNELWLRSASVMNDYSEIHHGRRCLDMVEDAGDLMPLFRFMEEVHPGAAFDLKKHYDNWRYMFDSDTYMICVSKHARSEDSLGRLSMWRAYGGSTGVALILNGGVMFRPSTVLGAYSSPVLYSDRDQFQVTFKKFVADLINARELIKTLTKSQLVDHLFNVLRYAILCTKHPGFAEEQEWRVIASPLLHGTTWTRLEVEVVRGVAQRVLKMPLKDSPSDNLTGLAIPGLLDRIIIGPSEFPAATYEAFHQLLLDAGIEDPTKRLVISNIPIRNL